MTKTKETKKTVVWEYLRRTIKERPYWSPNFWMSSAYFYHAGFQEVFEGGSWRILDSEGRQVLPEYPYRGGEYWADFPFSQKSDICDPGGSVFLDYNYFFLPYSLVEEQPGPRKKWKLWSKNLRRFFQAPENRGEAEYKPAPPEECKDVLTEWLLGRKEEEEIHDSETLMSYLEDPQPTAWYLGFYLNGELLGFNICDFNYRFINYRYCFHKPSFPFLNYGMRFLFYQYLVKEGRGYQLVNDGGTLGKASLEFFKNHMNPLYKEKIFSSWT